MPEISYDFHIHSCLSPCGDDDMTPANIAGMAFLNNLDVIALTDHNTCKNCPAIMKKAEEYGVTVIPGMELTTSEEIHVLCLFRNIDDALKFDSFVYEKLPDIKNKEEIFGKQQIMNENDEVIGNIDKLLINATQIGFDYLPDILKDFNGIMIPAHINKKSDSLLSVFGFIPPTSSFRCAEINKTADIEEVKKNNPYIENCKIITDSDAHYLQDISEKIHCIDVKGKTIEDIFDFFTDTV